LVALPTSTAELLPVKLKPSPTSPAAKPALVSVPLLPPIMSCAFPLPGHQETRPDGGGAQALTATAAA
jgi:hypothetical protein